MTNVSALSARSSQNVEIEILVPSDVEPGSYKLLVVADSSNLVAETNEEDNVYVLNVTVGVVCSSEHLEACDNQEDCEAHGGYWYDGSCHETPEERPEWHITCTNTYDRARILVSVEDCADYCGDPVNVLIMARSTLDPTVVYSWVPGLSWIQGMQRFSYVLTTVSPVDLLSGLYVPIDFISGWEVTLAIDLDRNGVFDADELELIARDICEFDLCNKYRTLADCEAHGCYWTGSLCVTP